MMYAVISVETGVIRLMSFSYDECIERVNFCNSYDDQCVIAKVPQLMLDDFGARLLELHIQEEVSE